MNRAIGVLNRNCRNGSPNSSGQSSAGAQRLRMRTQYDVEMMQQVGFCNGIENYSRHIDGRAPGRLPTADRLLPEDFLLVIDESHVTVPQIGGMYEGDMSLQAQPRGTRFPVAQCHGQPSAALGGVRGQDRTDDLPVGAPGPYEVEQGGRGRRRTGHPADRADRP